MKKAARCKLLFLLVLACGLAGCEAGNLQIVDERQEEPVYLSFLR